MLLEMLIISMGINLGLFIFAYVFQTDKLTDMSYGLTFILLGIYSYNNGVASTVLLAMIAIWAIRLSGFLLARIMKTGRDKRFDGIREKFGKFLGFWIIQGFSVWVIMIPAIMFMQKGNGLEPLAYIGLGIWAAGLTMETIADFQKYRFSQNPKNKGKWIDEGLWHYSRHPNYFGEILLWAGVYVFVFGGLSNGERIIALVSPLYIASLIIFFSGLPKLEAYADKKWGRNKKYKEYKKRTSILVPWFK